MSKILFGKKLFFPKNKNHFVWEEKSADAVIWSLWHCQFVAWPLKSKIVGNQNLTFFVAIVYIQKMRILSRKIRKQNKLTVWPVGKNIAFTKFLSKMCERISETTLCIITDFFREIEIFTQLFLDHFRLLIFSDLSSCEIVSCELWISKNARKVTRYLLEIDTAKCSKQLIFDMIRVLILIHPKLVSRKNRQNDNKASATL